MAIPFLRRFPMVLVLLQLVPGVCPGGDPAPAANAQRMSWLDNGHIRLGVDLSIGGAVTWLSDSGSSDNVINSHDWGRQVQMSFYSGPVPYQPPGKQLNPAWRALGWNPIQSGDCYGNRSRVLDHRNDGRSIYVKCVPMHWPLNGVPGECTFEAWYRLDARSVQVRCRLNNRRPDPTQYPGRSQELPAVYTNGPYHRLMTYRGDKPFTGDALAEIPKQRHPPGGIRWASWYASENWAALVNEQDWGLGVWNPESFSFIGGFAGGPPGAGGPRDAPTGYISPLCRDILDPNIVYEYRYVLILDTLANIRRFVYDRHPPRSLPDYRFRQDRGHFIYHQAVDTGWPIRGKLALTATGEDMQVIGPDGFWRAQSDHRLRITMAVRPVAPRPLQGTVYWKTLQDNTFSETRKLDFTVQSSGGPQTLRLALGERPGYRGVITGLRLDPIQASRPGDQVDLISVRIETE